MNFPAELKYTKDHEWVKIEGDIAIMGISEFAQSELGDIVFVDLPAPGKQVKQGETICVVESTKAASDVYAPLGGTVKESNQALGQSPEQVNKSPYKDGWLVKLSGINQGDLAALMTADQYKTFLGGKI